MVDNVHIGSGWLFGGIHDNNLVVDDDMIEPIIGTILITIGTVAIGHMIAPEKLRFWWIVMWLMFAVFIIGVVMLSEASRL